MSDYPMLISNKLHSFRNFDLQNYDLPEVRKAVAQKSKALLLKEWLKDGSVYENYDSVLGEGPHRRSDRFYHWGALLSYIALIEDGYIAPIKIND